MYSKKNVLYIYICIFYFFIFKGHLSYGLHLAFVDSTRARNAYCIVDSRRRGVAESVGNVEAGNSDARQILSLHSLNVVSNTNYVTHLHASRAVPGTCPTLAHT